MGERHWISSPSDKVSSLLKNYPSVLPSGGFRTLSPQATSSTLDPFRVEPQFVERIWGFRDLHPWFDRIAVTEPIGEVWLTGDDCLVSTGLHAGKKLGDLFQDVAPALLGQGAPATGSTLLGSPLLVKMLFAREKLSVQVHPDNDMANRYGEPNGKSECWYALATEPDAKVAVGLKPGVTLEQLQHEIEDGTLETSLNAIPITAGDMLYVDAGTVHAIWPGSILLETQQNCDLTYRMFDYGRPRELHVQKSLEATRLKTSAGKIAPKILPDRTILIDAEFLVVERIPVNDWRTSSSLHRDSSTLPGFAFLFAAAGSGTINGRSIESLDLPARGVIAVPASSPEFEVIDNGGLDLIRITAKERP